MAKDEEKDLELTFPEDYMSEELKGQKVVFKVKVNDIKTRVIPELNDEFFEDLGMDDVNNKEELEKIITEEITVRKEMDAENKYIDELLETASNNMKVEIEEELVLDEANRMYEQFLDKVAMQGLTEEIYLKYTNSTKEDILKSMEPEAENRIKYRYLLEAIIKEEKIKVTDKQAAKEAKELAEKYGMTSEEFLNELGGLEVLKYDMTMRKAIDCMKESN